MSERRCQPGRPRPVEPGPQLGSGRPKPVEPGQRSQLGPGRPGQPGWTNVDWNPGRRRCYYAVSGRRR
ncbi:hypothetical protein PHYSODRAFT_507603 [Phytophthora sojae]|uniref:Uncharacterized protein n=1 Tax=Phytophthora sojae (strain P6497) TaxID=1094619 RepID=G4ZM89_PHYSP|nr:hypothetical protein PHYSODRAFT_507603 [Phytophthora sojae]EGZ14622.1 hypothetical protein PHYSODRAFT_507603 [Phytophthora sojae]|eukprot:XP_009528371.1 hypothetical protein PHYSODRAFT_507603 [Phytophthora sojae]